MHIKGFINLILWS